MTKFYERIYRLRKERGLTQEEIANELNVSRQTISNWETGSAQPTIDKAIELANLYDVSMDELVGKNIKSVKKVSHILMSLLNEKINIYLEKNSFFVSQDLVIKNCQLIEVNVNSIRIIVEKRKDRIEKLILLKDVLGFERGVI